MNITFTRGAKSGPKSGSLFHSKPCCKTKTGLCLWKRVAKLTFIRPKLTKMASIVEKYSVIMETSGMIMEKIPQLRKLAPQLWSVFIIEENYYHNYGSGFAISGKSMPRISIIENFA